MHPTNARTRIEFYVTWGDDTKKKKLFVFGTWALLICFKDLKKKTELIVLELERFLFVLKIWKKVKTELIVLELERFLFVLNM